MRWCLTLLACAACLGDEPGWLKGSTHVHAKPSGDSSTPVDDVARWYDDHGYDFIVLTDHDRVTPPPAGAPLIVIPGVELTHNPRPTWRIHVNLLGPDARPRGAIAWERIGGTRLQKYDRALALGRRWDALVQINHPQWHWGMSEDLLFALARRGATLVEISNAQFEAWNDGDATHPSTEELWDAVLARGATMWGIASDDAHHYDGGGKYPAGGAWIMVRAVPHEEAILAAIARGDFYGSTGVTLARAERVGDELVVEVSPESPGEHAITFIGDGRTLAEVHGRWASHPLASASYVRAVVRRSDGARAWVQPHRRRALPQQGARRRPPRLPHGSISIASSSATYWFASARSSASS